MTELSMAPIYPITSLAKDVKTVKAEAEKGPVRITENGRGAFVFMSEEVLSMIVDRERQDAAYEAYLAESIARGVADVEAGRVLTSREAMFAEAERLRRGEEGLRA